MRCPAIARTEAGANEILLRQTNQQPSFLAAFNCPNLKRTMRWTLVIILALIILLAGYTVWPFYNLYRIASAVETRNSVALQGLVDFPSLRADGSAGCRCLSKTIGKSVDSDEGRRGLNARFGSVIADAMLAEIVLDPERLLDLLGKGSVSPNHRRRRVFRLPLRRTVWAAHGRPGSTQITAAEAFM